MARRRALAFVVTALVAGATLSPAAATDIAQDCVDGPVAQASAQRPAVVDPAGDLTDYGAVHRDSVDLRTAWVGLGEPTADGTTQYTFNIQVQDLLLHPVNATYYVVYTGARGAQFAAAQGYPDGTFRFRYGNIETSVTGGRLYAQTATATGRADTTAGVITIDVPATELPAKRADGKAVRLDITEVTSNIIVGSPERLPTPDGVPKQGFVYAADSVANGWICNSVLHEDELVESEN
ncbi:MAG TPA: hypothetical protein VM307_05645 [Egibacteraceae bacterium]|nr:hypothetical protein [Egibacteraceae bacterium]